MIDGAFDFHEWTPDQAQRGETVRILLENAAQTIVDLVPPGPARTAAIGNLSEARLWVNRAICREGRY